MATGTSASLTYDLNGNLTNDGTNSYSWDAEDRLIQITYPGSGNYSQFSYDPMGQLVQILEYTSGSLTSTKQFVWAGGESPEEVRNAGGTITTQYFGCGVIISSSDYFYTADLIGSIRELTNSSGTIEDQRTYDPFGRVTQIQGTIASDFQYAGYYFHAPSSLCLTPARAYNARLARWLSRDPLDKSGANQYAYVSNRPTISNDPSGLSIVFAVNSTEGFGHCAALIGGPGCRRSGQWNLYENDQMGGQRGTPFMSLDAYYTSSPNMSRQNSAYFSTEIPEDNAARTAALAKINLGYKPLTNNCVHTCRAAAAAANLEIPETPRDPGRKLPELPAEFLIQAQKSPRYGGTPPAGLP